MVLRRSLYEKGIVSSFRSPIPCISVGNISWGGTGKTPVVDYLLHWASQQGRQGAVLTRGYGGKPPILPYPVRPESPVAHSGDEALMLARKHPEAMILVDPQRRRAARMALASASPPDFFILDDGLQHLAMGRGLDLVLLDKDDVLPTPASNWNRVIPAGSWREPQRALAAASAFLIKTTPGEWPEIKEHLPRRLGSLDRPVFAFALEPCGLRDAQGNSNSPQDLPGEYCLVTGVGNPSQVKETVTRYLGRPPAQELAFKDHCDFSAAATTLRALPLPVLCTTKDLVKLDTLELPQLYALDVQACFFAASGTSQNFAAWLGQQVFS